MASLDNTPSKHLQNTSDIPQNPQKRTHKKQHSLLINNQLCTQLHHKQLRITHVGVQCAGWDAAVNAYPPKLASFSHKGANALTSQYHQSIQCCLFPWQQPLTVVVPCAHIRDVEARCGRVGVIPRRTPSNQLMYQQCIYSMYTKYMFLC